MGRKLDNSKPMVFTDQVIGRKWNHNAIMALKKSRQAMIDGKATDAKNYAVVAGIATEKAALLSGRPTQIIDQSSMLHVNITALASRFGVKLPHPAERTEAPLAGFTLPALPTTSDGDDHGDPEPV